MKKTNAPRGDRKTVKERIIQAAGQLIAEQGFSDTTSKSICERAGVNLAAVNYHFESREGLYKAVIEEVHKQLLNLESLSKLWESSLTPKEKLEKFIDDFVFMSLGDGGWYLGVWIRELVSPSPQTRGLLSKEIRPKFGILSRIFSEVTGLSLNDPKLYSYMVSVMGPFMILFLTKKELISEVAPPNCSVDELASHIKNFVFAGLKTFSSGGNF